MACDACTVNDDGGISGKVVSFSYAGVRPALWINL
jgi:hypothetical protein